MELLYRAIWFADLNMTIQYYWPGVQLLEGNKAFDVALLSEMFLSYIVIQPFWRKGPPSYPMKNVTDPTNNRPNNMSIFFGGQVILWRTTGWYQCSSIFSVSFPWITLQFRRARSNLLSPRTNTFKTFYLWSTLQACRNLKNTLQCLELTPKTEAG